MVTARRAASRRALRDMVPRRTTNLAIAASLCIGFVLCACRAQAPGAASAASPTPTVALAGPTDRSSAGPSLELSPPPLPVAPAHATEVIGTLVGEGGGSSCAYLAAADGTRWYVMYPVGWTLQTGDAPQLVAPDGRVVAHQGDTVHVTGGVPDSAPAFCTCGTPFEATEVLTPSS